jgi:hypothetical protein
MTITIRLKTDNAAFEHDREEEAFRIAREGLDRLLIHGRPKSRLGYGLRDSNGNVVGSVTVKGK